MNRIRYKPKIFTALILSLILGLSTCVSSIGTYTVYATNIQPNDNVHGDTDRAYGYQKGGLSESKGGAIISLRDANGNPVAPTVLASNSNSGIPGWQNVTDHWGNPVQSINKDFTTAQLLGSNTYSLTGQDVQKTITNFLHNVDRNGDSGFTKLLNNAFGMSPDQIKSLAGKGVHIVVETVITVSYKDGGTLKTFSGTMSDVGKNPVLANDIHFANALRDTIANNFALKEAYGGLLAGMLDGKHSLADLLAQGLGMGEFNMDELLGLMGEVDPELPPTESAPESAPAAVAPNPDSLMSNELNLPFSTVSTSHSWNRQVARGSNEGRFSTAYGRIQDAVAEWKAYMASFKCTKQYYAGGHCACHSYTTTFVKYKSYWEQDGTHNAGVYTPWVIEQTCVGSLNGASTASALHSVIDYGSNSSSVPSHGSFKYWSDGYYSGDVSWDWPTRNAITGESGHNDGNNDLNIRVQPDYAYNVTRMIWNDDLVASEVAKTSVPSYVTSVLGFTSGKIGHLTSPNGPVASGAVTQLNQLSDFYSWNLKFTGDFIEDLNWNNCQHVQGVFHSGSHYDNRTYNEDGSVASGESDHCPGGGSAGYHRHDQNWFSYNEMDWTKDIASYGTLHDAQKFRVQETPYGYAPHAGDKHENNPVNLLGYHGYGNMCFFTEQGEIKYWPNVEYVYFNADSTYYDTNSVSIGKVYMLGEIERDMKVPLAHAYKVINFNPTGSTTLPNTLTGANAGSATSSNGTVAMGSTFEVAEDSSFRYDIMLETVGFYISDFNGRNGAWGNTWSKDDIKSSHDNFKSQISGYFDADIIMTYKTVSLTNASDAGAYASDVYHLQNSTPEYTSVDDNGESTFDWIHGAGDERGNAFSHAFHSADSDYGTYGLHEVLDTIFVSDSDGDNASGNGNMYSAQTQGRQTWYDESVPEMHVAWYTTKYTFYPLIADDKVDYSTLGQNALNKMANGKSALKTIFYHRIYLNDGTPEAQKPQGFDKGVTITVDGFDFLIPYTLGMKEIVGSDFIVTNSTTANAIKR